MLLGCRSDRDICRSLKGKMIPYCDDIMSLLLENLSNAALHKSVKPQILSVFGDMALSIGPEFKKYLPVVLQMLQHASQCQVDTSDYDMVDYLIELRESVLEAYTGILQGLKGTEQKPSDDVKLMEPHIHSIVSFLMTIARDPDVPDSNLAGCAGLLGDLCTVYGMPLLHLIDNEGISGLLNAGRNSRIQRTKALSSWAVKTINLLKQQPQQQQQQAIASW